MDTAQTATDSLERESLLAASTGDPGALQNAQALWNDLRELAHVHLQLAALETQRAGKSLVNMAIYAVAAALLLVSAWLGLMGAGVLWLIAWSLNATLALLFVVVLSIAAACVLFMMIRRSSQQLRFPATVRSLKSDASMFADPVKS